jgi:hypothetical protein
LRDGAVSVTACPSATRSPPYTNVFSIPPLDALHAMQFRTAPPPQVRSERPAQRPSASDRDCPLDTVRARCLWHAGGTADENDHLARGGNGSQLVQSVMPVLGDHRLEGKPRMRRGSSSGPVGVVDACGALVLRDQGPIGRPGTARPILVLILACRTARRLPRLPGLPDLLCGLRSVKRQSRADRSSSFTHRITAYGEYTVSAELAPKRTSDRMSFLAGPK